MIKLGCILFFLSSIVLPIQAQSNKDYYKYIDTVNAWIEHSSFGPVIHLKRTATSFGEINPKPYHLVFNFRYAYIKEQFPVFVQSLEKSGYLDSLLIDTQIRGNGEKKILYLGIDVPFEVQSAIIVALLDKIGIVDEVVLLRKGQMAGDTREVVVGGSWCPHMEQQRYLRRFNTIRQLVQAKNKAELINLFETLNEGYSRH